MKKRIVCLLLCVVMLCATVFTASSCSKPPEYAEIESRFIELVEASYEVNKLLFGEGLPTYERVYDPWDDMQAYEMKNEEGKSYYVYYYTATDETLGDIAVYRTGYGVSRKEGCVQIQGSADATREAVFTDAEKGVYCYEVEYTEPSAEFYYSKKDPAN